tara:strand:- start:413 stop:922 length:510 start_codon:yes stop_codon:yes gene_type:complete
MEFNDEILKLFFVIISFSFLAILIAGATNKITIFNDYGDLWLTLGFIIWPLIGFMILSLIVPEDASDNYNILLGSPSSAATTIITSFATFYSLIKTMTNSINANGAIIGVIVGIFKILSSIIIIFSVIGLFNKINEKNSGYGNKLIFISIFTFIFYWALKTLVNGERVR